MIAEDSTFSRKSFASSLAPIARRLRRRVPVLIGKARTELVRWTYGPRLLAKRITHVHGPTEIDYGPDEVIVISVVRNGALYLDAFIKHHLSLGVKHIVLLDNDSTDGTPRMASEYDQVTVLSTTLPYRHYENLMKTYLARRFSRDRWNLCCDIDEMFDFPGSDRMPLGNFLGYLNDRGFSAVVAQMLDMVADRPLSALRDRPGDGLFEVYGHYDLSDIEKVEYAYSDVPVEPVMMHFGGVRKAVFGTRNGLSKAALVQVRDKIELFRDWHHTRHASVADVTCVLRHYPFTSAFYEKVKEAARSGRYGFLTSDEYQAYWSVLAKQPALNLRLPGARRYEGTGKLLADGFLVGSKDYLNWVRSHSRLGEPTSTQGD